MSGYAASVGDTVKSSSSSKHRKSSKHQKVAAKVKKEESYSLSGFHIRERCAKTTMWCLETYLSLIYGSMVVGYIVGKKILVPDSDNSNRNPYSEVNRPNFSKAGSYKDLSKSSAPTHSKTHQLKPPECLDDPVLGTHKFIKIQGVNFHYTEAGYNNYKPPILLVHGAMDFWFTWRKIIPALSRRFKVYCLDLRGCGDSEKPWSRTSYTLDILVEDIAGFIRSVGGPVEDSRSGMIVMSTGWGGQITWALADKYPGLVRKMILIHSPHPYILRPLFQFSIRNCYQLWKLLVAKLPFIPEWALTETNLNDIVDKFEEMVRNGTITENEKMAYLYNFSRSEDLTGSLHHLRNWTLWQKDSLSSLVTNPKVLTTPTLLLMGDSDPNIPLEAAYKSAEFVERIKTRVIFGGGPQSQVTHSEELLSEVATFLNEPRILEPDSTLSTDDEDWDETVGTERTDEDGPQTLVGRFMDASLTAMVGWSRSPKK